MNNPLINITKRLIENSVPRDMKSCMIAKALEIRFPGAIVDARTMASKGDKPLFFVRTRRLTRRFTASNFVQRQMVDFDQLDDIRSFKFRLRPAPVSLYAGIR